MLNRRTLLAASAAATLGIPEVSHEAEIPKKTMYAWRANVRNWHYSNSALVLEHADGMLVVEHPSSTFYHGSPGIRLGAVYLAPHNMRVNLFEKVEVPAALFDAAVALYEAHANMSQFGDALKSLIFEN